MGHNLEAVISSPSGWWGTNVLHHSLYQLCLAEEIALVCPFFLPFVIPLLTDLSIACSPFYPWVWGVGWALTHILCTTEKVPSVLGSQMLHSPALCVWTLLIRKESPGSRRRAPCGICFMFLNTFWSSFKKLIWQMKPTADQVSSSCAAMDRGWFKVAFLLDEFICPWTRRTTWLGMGWASWFLTPGA